MRHWPTLWTLSALMLSALQLTLGTDVAFVVVSLVVFLLVPTVYRTLAVSDNMGALVFAATFAKLFLISQWIKVAYMQPADSHLQSPLHTVLTLFLALLAFWICGYALRPLAGRGGFLPIRNDPGLLRTVAAVAVTLTMLSMVLRHLLGYNRVGEEEYVEGRGYVVILYLGMLMPLAVTALTARAALISDGRRFIDPLVALALLACIAQGIWENQRNIMLAGAVGFAAAYLSYGGLLRGRHIAAVAVGAVAMQVLIFPLIDLQRGFDRTLSPLEYLGETFNTAGELTKGPARTGLLDDLDRMYEDWDTRLYYGNPTGFLDRFVPGAIDETVAFFQEGDPFGADYLLSQISYGVPNVILLPLGIERPMRGGERLESTILGRATNMNYGLIPEVYASVGPILFLPVLAVVLIIYFASLQILYGSFSNNYFSCFGFTTLYFSIANTDLAEMVPQLTIQGALNITILFVILTASKIIRKRTPAGSPSRI